MSIDTELILLEHPAKHVARIVLNRPSAANAQNTAMLYALNEAFDTAAQDDDVRVIILAANGKHFSSGHDLRESDTQGAMGQFRSVTTQGGYTSEGAERQLSREEEIYVGLCERWRNIPKPTIAAVHGRCMAGGLMLVWPCDIILASEDAIFSDPVISFGIPGVEYFMHPWEVGVRKAKEYLFTADEWTAGEAHRLGMVNHVVPREQLEDFTMAMALRIARNSRLALKLAKQAVNAAQDVQGRGSALSQAFALHHVAHAHWLAVSGNIFDVGDLPVATRKALRGDDKGVANP